MSEIIRIDLHDSVLTGRRSTPKGSHRVTSGPLIVAIHGGGYTSAYFDVPGHSLLDRAAAAGVQAVSFDRPSYGGSSKLAVREGVLRGNAERLSNGIAELWRRNDGAAQGVVLVGHSIGAATVSLIASMAPEWPLLGIAISGASLASPPGRPSFLDHEPPDGLIPSEPEMVTSLMFGPEGSYAEDVPPKARTANEPAVFREVVEIVNEWPNYAADVFAKIRVPVQYRQAEHDVLVLQAEGEVDRVRQAFFNAPSVDAEMIHGVGHAIDFHDAGGAFQAEQIAFAIACAKRSRLGASLRPDGHVGDSIKKQAKTHLLS